MALPRVIPVLLLKDHGLIKTREFKDPVYVGDPVNTVKLFNDKEVDEIIIVDTMSSRCKADPDYQFLTELASECFMPLTYGGGVKNLDQIKSLMQCGVEKVMINTALLEDPLLLRRAVDSFGSSSIIAAVDIRVNLWGSYKVYNHVRKRDTALDYMKYIELLEGYGAGELFFNHVSRDGTMKGYDTELIRSITKHVSVPVISCGGCSSFSDIEQVLHEGGAQAAAAGSFFVFHGPHRAVLISYLSRAELEKAQRIRT